MHKPHTELRFSNAVNKSIEAALGMSCVHAMLFAALQIPLLAGVQAYPAVRAGNETTDVVGVMGRLL